MKRTKDLSSYTTTLPYASEIFGVYQPLIGWRSRRIRSRIEAGFAADIHRAFGALYERLKGRFEFTLTDDRTLERIRLLEPARLDVPANRQTGSFVLDRIAAALPPAADYDERVWDELIQPDRLTEVLAREVVPRTTEWYRSALEQPVRREESPVDAPNRLLADQLNRESTVAGYLLYLKEHQHLDRLKELFYRADRPFAHLLQLLQHRDPLELFDPFQDIDRAHLSPIGIVHLFRQYFFELDTFLGPPVSHVWLSPGGTVELLEISTRRTLVERTTETSVESILKTEKETTEQDEVSDAVKQDNKSETKFGMTATANQGWIGGSASASASLDMGTTQSQARETAHKHMRQQTERLSTEIRKNYKSTFRTVTETTDTSSKRYVLTNTTPELLNYELRRKLRQVGVQVQDIGTYLCWQTFVDDPGRQLGVAQLVHLAKQPEVGEVPPPEAIPNPGGTTTEREIDIPFVQTSEDEGDLDESYRDGREVDEDFNEGDVETIQHLFDGYVAVADQPGYRYDTIQWDYRGNDVEIELGQVTEDPVGKISFGFKLAHVNFRGNRSMRVVAKIRWEPTTELLDDIRTKNEQKIDQFNEQTKEDFRQAFVDAARDRITKSSNLTPRPFAELREEERIVVYRRLIQDMLTKNLPLPDDRTRHTVSELLNAIFDIDKMLYFVAPEWWRPRLHHSHQALGGIRTPAPLPGGSSGTTAGTVYGQLQHAANQSVIKALGKAKPVAPIAAMDTVAWGGGGRVDNYYITEDSQPAKLGSSLGWLLQLDGDNLRNAFLNAPWVKAVIPIRPGKERAAMNWLQRVHVEGADGLDDDYVAPPEELAKIPHSGETVTLRDAINHLCDVVAKKHQESMMVDRYPEQELDDDNRVSATPVDKVYEHGFYPLQGGFRVTPADDFAVFDQWVEVLPTDQVVPVEVAYDPKTGRQL
ncbi:MAG: hypothetical protein ACRDT2_01815 [Natronosporangium sp.]